MARKERITHIHFQAHQTPTGKQVHFLKGVPMIEPLLITFHCEIIYIYLNAGFSSPLLLGLWKWLIKVRSYTSGV